MNEDRILEEMDNISQNYKRFFLDPLIKCETLDETNDWKCPSYDDQDELNVSGPYIRIPSTKGKESSLTYDEILDRIFGNEDKSCIPSEKFEISESSIDAKMRELFAYKTFCLPLERLEESEAYIKNYEKNFEEDLGAYRDCKPI